MNTQRITISLPYYLYKMIQERLKESGQSQSHYAREALEQKVMEVPFSQTTNAVDDWLALRGKYKGKSSTTEQLIANMRKGLE